MKSSVSKGFALLDAILAIAISSIVLISSSYFAMRKSEEEKYKYIGRIIATISQYGLKYIDLYGREIAVSEKRKFLDASFKELKLTSCSRGERDKTTWGTGLACELNFTSENSVKFKYWQVDRLDEEDFKYKISFKKIDPRLISNKSANSIVRKSVEHSLELNGFETSSLAINFDVSGTENSISMSAINRQYLKSDGSVAINKGKKICWKISSGTNVCMKGEEGSVSIIDNSGTLSNLKANAIITRDTNGKNRTSLESSVVRNGDKLKKPKCPKSLKPNLAMSLISYGVKGGSPNRNNYTPDLNSVKASGALALGWRSEGEHWVTDFKTNSSDVEPKDIIALAMIWCDM